MTMEPTTSNDRLQLSGDLSTIATGVQSAIADAPADGAPVYDLLGRRVNGKRPLSKGIYISKNKKTVR